METVPFLLVDGVVELFALNGDLGATDALTLHVLVRYSNCSHGGIRI